MLCLFLNWVIKKFKSVLRSFAKLTGKHLCQSIFFNKVANLCKINQKDTCIKELEEDFTSNAKLSIESNLVFGKIKFMLM